MWQSATTLKAHPCFEVPCWVKLLPTNRLARLSMLHTAKQILVDLELLLLIRFAGDRLQASYRRSLVQPRSLRAILIRFPSSFLSMCSPPLVRYKYLFCTLIAYIPVDAKNSGC